nr:class I SAM-dependent methyltransferase [uncultured Rhodopila sp.]
MNGNAAAVLTDRAHDQCVFETRIAHQLRTAPQQERLRLYTELYNEYTEKFPETLPKDSSAAERIARYETAFLRRFLKPSTVMAEIGPGRCHLAVSLAPHVARIYGVDVAEVGAGADKGVPNFELKRTDGIHMPFDSDSIDLVISNQLMEHLHPDDACDQLREVHRVLRAGGRYICITPSRVNGPHDSSARFRDIPCPVRDGDYRANGLHLQEYTTRELMALFEAAGFTRFQSFIGTRGHYVGLHPSIMNGIESTVRLLPPGLRKRSRLLSAILGNRVCGTK